MHPVVKVGFSKFAELRPKECVLAGESGTHSVCVCLTHQKIKLLVSGCQLETLTKGELKQYRDCLAAIQCAQLTTECCTAQCKECPGTTALHSTCRLDAIMHSTYD